MFSTSSSSKGRSRPSDSQGILDREGGRYSSACCRIISDLFYDIIKGIS